MTVNHLELLRHYLQQHPMPPAQPKQFIPGAPIGVTGIRG
jgi:hypothetical protein